jgi:uncharacterized protein YwqG
LFDYQSGQGREGAYITMTRQNFIEKLKEQNLYHHLERFEAVTRNCIHLSLVSNNDKDIPIGQSKIGGRPDLPNSLSWVTEKERKNFLFSKVKPLSFIAQINLAEVSQYDVEHLLPQKGMLYFFYSAEQEAWGFDIKDKPKFKVLFFEKDVHQLKRMEFPEGLPEHARYTPCIVNATTEISIPYFRNEQLSFLSEEELDRYYYILDESTNKLLGYADPIQNEMELECELVTNGLYCGDASGYNNPKAKSLEPNAVNWKLLLQIDSNEENSMMWGDMGRLYFWIRKEDLRNKKFDSSWFVLQCS